MEDVSGFGDAPSIKKYILVENFLPPDYFKKRSPIKLEFGPRELSSSVVSRQQYRCCCLATGWVEWIWTGSVKISMCMAYTLRVLRADDSASCNQIFLKLVIIENFDAIWPFGPHYATFQRNRRSRLNRHNYIMVAILSSRYAGCSNPSSSDTNGCEILGLRFVVCPPFHCCCITFPSK